MSEIIEHGVNGLIHRPRNPEAFAACVEEVISSPARRWEMMRLAARETWRQKFNTDIMIEGLIRIYEDLAVLP
jgi:glycosyltransferase involved in cell wall biosynthesis